jgi:tetratricopeptide (TPR) repeat protein
MLTQFPNSDYIPVVKGFLDEVQESLALSDYGVGDYYAQHGNPWGASSRFKEITEKYARFSKMDEVDFLLAQALLKMENTDEAAKYLARIAEGYPFSKYFDEAKAQLQQMGKPVPEVNPQLAAQNQALLKPPEPFSPLRPLIQFAEAIGFKGPADRFTQAQRVIAARKAEAEAAAAAANKPQTSTEGGEVLINATLKQNTNGQTVGGTSTNVTPAKTDKKDDTKKQDDTTKKKKKSE